MSCWSGRLRSRRARTRSRAALTSYVPLALWEQRNQTVNARFDHHGKEIGTLRTDIQSCRVSWPAVASFVTGLTALLILLIQNIG